MSFPGSFTCIPTFSGSTGRSFASFPSSSVKVPLKANEFQPLSPSFTPNGTTQSTYIFSVCPGLIIVPPVVIILKDFALVIGDGGVFVQSLSPGIVPPLSLNLSGL